MANIFDIHINGIACHVILDPTSAVSSSPNPLFTQAPILVHSPDESGQMLATHLMFDFRPLNTSQVHVLGQDWINAVRVQAI